MWSSMDVCVFLSSDWRCNDIKSRMTMYICIIYAVSMFHEQAAPAATSIPITSVARHIPTLVLSQEQRDDYRPLPVSHFFKEDKAYPVSLFLYPDAYLPFC